MEMRISFPGRLRVEADFQGFNVATDQSFAHGGEQSAPEPFDLFLASLGTCAGLFALRFCENRNLDTTGLGLLLTSVRDPQQPRVETIRLEIQLPPHFPPKYHDAIVRAADQCTVKRHILQPPAFEIVAVPHRNGAREGVEELVGADMV